MEFNKVILDIEDGVAILRFNDPEVLNAVGGDMLSGLHAAVAELQKPLHGVRCLLLTGEGRGFCSGANLSPGPERGDRRQQPGSSLRGGYHPLLITLKNLNFPMVTAVNGAAAGVGMSFAIMADIVCASEKAFFLQAFARIGLVPDGGATFLLPRLIGMGKAMELSLLAERLPASKAYEWGLVNRLYETNEELMTGSLELAKQLAKGPASLGMIRKLYWDSLNNSYETQLDLESQYQASAGQTADNQEGVRAFLEKRDAIFRGE